MVEKAHAEHKWMAIADSGAAGLAKLVFYRKMIIKISCFGF